MVNPDIIKKPLLSEKANELSETGQYIFIVDINANKIQIKQAIEAIYGVTVESVSTMRYLGKPKSRYTSSRIVKGRSASYKKAVVRLSEDDFIDIYGNV